jgi:GNAT superfamily N-acetyltransferase
MLKVATRSSTTTDCLRDEGDAPVSEAQPSADFIARHSAELTLRSGDRVRLRPLIASDRDGIAAAYRRMSRESKRMRFFVPLAELTPEMLTELSEVDHFDHAAWLALVEEDGRWTGIGIARYIRDSLRPTTAEAAVTVVDSFQGHGIGTVLLEVLTLAALDHGIAKFVGQVLRDNDRMLSVLRHAHAHFEFDEPGVLRFEIDLPERVDELRDTSLYRVLKAVAEGQPADDEGERMP